MIIEKTERLECRSEMNVVNGLPEPSMNISSENNEIDIFNIKSPTAQNYGFEFYEKETGEFVCQIHFEEKRKKYEVSYGTEERFRGKGYMKEALSFFVEWIFSNTDLKEMVALINNHDESQHILEETGFIKNIKDEFGDWFVIRKGERFNV